MPISIPSIPNLTVQQPQQADPLSQFAKAAQLKNMLSEQSVRQQLAPLQIQQQTQENQQRQIQLDSSKAMMEAISTGALNKFAGADTPDGSGFDASGAYTDLIKKGVLPEHAAGIVNQFQTVAKNNSEIRKNTAQANQDSLKVRDESHQQMAQDISDILKLPAEQALKALDTKKAEYAKKPLPGIEQSTLDNFQKVDLSHLPLLAGAADLTGRIESYHAKQAKEAAEATAAQQKVIPAGGGLSPETQQGIAKDVAVASNPQIQAGKVAVATAEGQARANVEAAQARGANAAVAKVPPHLVAPAIADYNKLGDEYAAAQGAANDMKTFIDMARGGNKLAYSYAPTEGVLTFNTGRGVKRVNMPEIESYGGAGSAADRVKGFLGKQVSGASIPGDVLNDMESLHGAIATNAKDLYGKKVDVLNQSYGSSFKPADFGTAATSSKYTPPANAQSATGPNGHKIVVDNGKWVDAATGKPI